MFHLSFSIWMMITLTGNQQQRNVHVRLIMWFALVKVYSTLYSSCCICSAAPQKSSNLFGTFPSMFLLLSSTPEREREHSDKIPSFWHRADSQVSEFKVMDRSKQIGNVRRARSREIAQNKLSYSASRHHLRLWRFINDDGLLNG